MSHHNYNQELVNNSQVLPKESSLCQSNESQKDYLVWDSKNYASIGRSLVHCRGYTSHEENSKELQQNQHTPLWQRSLWKWNRSTKSEQCRSRIAMKQWDLDQHLEEVLEWNHIHKSEFAFGIQRRSHRSGLGVVVRLCKRLRNERKPWMITGSQGVGIDRNMIHRHGQESKIDWLKKGRNRRRKNEIEEQMRKDQEIVIDTILRWTLRNIERELREMREDGKKTDFIQLSKVCIVNEYLYKWLWTNKLTNWITNYN